ncbi:Beta-galactosidase [Ruminiclostridium papyrosolvens DSM 2782]|uniref:Beta-galactosidase n=1 Tax=Ruminiclostridium papyrosolvens DSM 2782 TaxID=588581 RepID=F1TGF4_9FIRM|nr:beta-galactosidase [Ruminiclostridium papyrosolvens]EGD46519.1 Beta-galactosidase [Ruminiclostridium papyrosolvens DSM 2782]WES35250.1 beta-galactosidase [Ruminiclostridium papyrosolvens DSM 2782]
MNKYMPIGNKFPHILHGGDYNPEQWLETPNIINEDFRLMKLAHCNTMTVGIFSWVALEPEEGKYRLDWLDDIMDRLAQNGMKAVLATPSGAKPPWMSQKYPEILRTQADRLKDLHGGRHNHCFTSPIYRKKVSRINRMLAERYGNHPALILWHISNEFSGECHCPLCQNEFRKFLQNKYDNDLERLNHEWWTGFWSHRYTDWSQIESPSPRGEHETHGLILDWKRFVSHQTIDFFKNEIKPLRELTPEVPVTTNLMGTFPGIEYRELAKELDVVSWDNYPTWHTTEQTDWKIGLRTSFVHDLNRSLKQGKPFMMMESTPSTVNWQKTNKLKRPGMHMLSSLQAVAHGSDTVQYFQWRKSRGSFEKFHGAVVDHSGHENTRVFRDVAQLGQALEKLDEVVGTTAHSQVAIIFDWENRWALEEAQALARERLQYEETCISHYAAFWKQGVTVDIIGAREDLSQYKLVIAPMLYMTHPGVGERIEAFVREGGTFVTTYWSGIVNENDLCHLGGFPGPLLGVTGIWSEEIDTLHADENNSLLMSENFLGLSGSYRVMDFCELIRPEAAQVLAVYGDDFYQGRPALTVNRFGKGDAYYMAARTGEEFLDDFYMALMEKLSLTRTIETKLPIGVTAQQRTDGQYRYIFIMNFNSKKEQISLNGIYTDMFTQVDKQGVLELDPFDVKVLKAKAK